MPCVLVSWLKPKPNLIVLCSCNVVRRAAATPHGFHVPVCVQLDAAWTAASAGLSVIIASGKDKDGVLQVTAGVCLHAHVVLLIT